MKYNNRDNLINRERSSPSWGKLARYLACKKKACSRYINKIAYIQVNIPMVLVSILSHQFIGLGHGSLCSIKA